jgi:NADPH2:quinone reductase
VPAFRAFRINQQAGEIAAAFETLTLDELTAGELVIKVAYSTINFKDALAATGAGKILRSYPLVGGIDLAGKVVSSSDPSFDPGQNVVVTGGGLSQTHDGGYAEYARVRAEWAVPLPDGLSAFQAMGLGTAGFTAALAIHRMEQNDQRPENGEVLITGATGGVGSLAINMLAARGYRVVALTGKAGAAAYLGQLGAIRIVNRETLTLAGKPLETAQWAGAIDNVGGEVLGWLTRTTQPLGNIASVGNAGGIEFKTTVLPFILRGVNLLGINSAVVSTALRLELWRRLATDLKPPQLDSIITQTIDFEQLPSAFAEYLSGNVVGRTVVKIGH